MLCRTWERSKENDLFICFTLWIQPHVGILPQPSVLEAWNYLFIEFLRLRESDDREPMHIDLSSGGGEAWSKFRIILCQVALMLVVLLLNLWPALYLRKRYKSDGVFWIILVLVGANHTHYASLGYIVSEQSPAHWPTSRWHTAIPHSYWGGGEVLSAHSCSSLQEGWNLYLCVSYRRCLFDRLLLMEKARQSA